MHRGAAPVDGAGDGALAGEPLDGVEDLLLERVLGVQVAVDRPAVANAGQQHRGVLAGAVHVHGGGAATIPEDLDACGAVRRQVGRALQRVLRQRGLGEDAPNHRDMGGGSRVAGRGKHGGEGTEVHPRIHDGDRLERLHAGPGKDGGVDVADPSDDVRVLGHDHGRAEVARLDEVVAGHDRELFGIGGEEDIRHGNSGVGCGRGRHSAYRCGCATLDP